jgi:hypothetical protein
MAFGKTLKAPKEQPADGGQVSLTEWHWLNTQEGRRFFRLMPALNEDGSLVQEPVLDPVGKPTKKKTTVPEQEVRWLEAWWPVMVDGQEQKRRLFLNPANRWKNPLWLYIAEHFEKKSPERSLLKDRFGVNVLDMTPVLFDEQGRAVYPDIDGKYVILAHGKRLEKPLEGTPEPHNKLRILEGSAGDAGGKHLLQDIMNNADMLTDPDGNPKQLHEVTIIMTTRGTGIKTTRSTRASSDFAPWKGEFTMLPRYDIATWVKPWSDEMITRLIEGEDFNQLVQEYKIPTFPKLFSTTEEELFD